MKDAHLPEQKILANILQHDILPYYATPFPEQPVYKSEKNQTQKQIKRPFFGNGVASYSDYIKRVQQGNLLPRTIHGPRHACHVALLTQLLLNLPRADSRPLPINRLWLGITGGSHDKSRQDEEKDRWDRDSALFIQSYLQALGVKSKKSKRFAIAMAEKDPKDGKFTDLVQELIHDADALEINRVLSHPKQEFKTSNLCFFRHSLLSTQEKEALVAEVQLFIALTDTFEVKLYMERKSTDYYGDLMRLMHEIHQKMACFSQLNKWLAKEIAIFTDQKVDQILLNLVLPKA